MNDVRLWVQCIFDLFFGHNGETHCINLVDKGSLGELELAAAFTIFVAICLVAILHMLLFLLLFFMAVFIIAKVMDFLSKLFACVVFILILIARVIVAVLGMCIALVITFLVELCTVATTNEAWNIARILFEILEHVVCFRYGIGVVTELVL